MVAVSDDGVLLRTLVDDVLSGKVSRCEMAQRYNRVGGRCFMK